MNPNFDPERPDPLLDRVLHDEGWEQAQAALKTVALGAFHARQRQRRLTRWAGGVAVVALAVAIPSATHWFRQRPAPPPPRIASKAPVTAPESEAPRYLSDQELLALFPKGSCFLAEVDGKKELVFFDPRDERTYLAKPRPAGE